MNITLYELFFGFGIVVAIVAILLAVRYLFEISKTTRKGTKKSEWFHIAMACDEIDISDVMNELKPIDYFADDGFLVG